MFTVLDSSGPLFPPAARMHHELPPVSRGESRLHRPTLVPARGCCTFLVQTPRDHRDDPRFGRRGAVMLVVGMVWRLQQRAEPLRGRESLDLGLAAPPRRRGDAR